MNTAFNLQHHLNRQCVVLSRDSICALCEYNKKRKMCKCTSMIPYVRSHMWFSNATKQIAPCSNWCKCKSDGWIHVFTTRVKILDSTIRLVCPDRLSKEIRSEGERGAQNTWISQCHIHCHNVTFTLSILHIWNLGFKLRFHMLYGNT